MTFARGDWFFILLAFIDGFFMARPYLYAIQQDNYRISEIFGNRHIRLVFLIDCAVVVVFLSIWGLLYFLQAREFWGFITTMFFFLTEFALYFMEDLPSRKKPLKYTKRAVRCLFFVALMATACVSVSMGICNAQLNDVYLRYLIFFVYPMAFPIVFIIGGGIINGFERLNNRRYERRTEKILTRNDRLIKIAVTGSYGKTTVKNILAEMLKQKYNVLVTPASYNTPMGIALTADKLDSTCDVFLAEFGARRKGDIKKLMQLVKPTYTLLTGINSQHLQTFGSQENIIAEKCRVINMLPDGGVAVANEGVRAQVENCFGKRDRIIVPIYAGLSADADVYADNISLTQDGSAFDLVTPDGRYPAFTPLIGRHNIENIVLAAAMARELYIEPLYILEAISLLQPVEHRMQLINGNGIKIIDDSFNSNPDGAKCALDTLAMFEGRKVVLTPGLVELGKREEEENRILGVRISEVADMVMLVGARRTDPIKRGLCGNGFGGEIHIYESLADAERDFVNRLHVGDILLILNDLPDIYDDKR